MPYTKSDPEADQTTVCTLPNNTILFVGQINDSSCGDFLGEFLSLDALPKINKTITIKFFSNGGNVDPGRAMYDAIRMANKTVRIEGYGAISSIATLVFMAGDERVIAPECVFMVHDGSADQGDMELSTAVRRIEAWKRDHNRYLQIMSERSGQDIENLRIWSASETYFNAKQCIEYGFAHDIMKGPK